MHNATITFHKRPTSGQVPTEDILNVVWDTSEEFGEIIEAAMLELVDCESFAVTFTQHITGNLWCINIYHKKKWVFVFFAVLGNTLVFLNGYIKKAVKLPDVSKNHTRKALYLLKEAQEMQYAR